MPLLAIVAYDTNWHGTSMVAYVMKWHGTSTGSYLMEVSFEEEFHWRPQGLHGSSVGDF